MCYLRVSDGLIECELGLLVVELGSFERVARRLYCETIGCYAICDRYEKLSFAYFITFLDMDSTDLSTCLSIDADGAGSLEYSCF